VKPILYPSTEKAFTTNGIGILTDAASCFVDAELNSVYELEMEYPVNGLHFGEICQSAIIMASPEPKAAPQPFRIYRISKPLRGKIRIYARHIAYDLQGIPVAPFKAASAQEAMAALKNNAVTDCPFSFETDKDTEATMEVAEPKDAWKLLGKSEGGVLSVYGGEYEFDRFTIRLRKRVGEDRGVTIRYGWNLTSADQDENCASVYTGVYPYWKGDDGELITLAERIVPAEGNFDHIKILPLDLSSYFGEAPTQDQLRTRAERYMRDHEIGVPEVSLTVSYVRLSQTEEYLYKPLMEEIRMGDSVTVIFRKMGIHTTARVVKTRYNVLRERHESISVGRVKSSFSDSVAKESMQHREDIARLGGGLAAQAKDIEQIEEDQEKLRLDTVALTADIGDVRAGLYAIASADDIKGLKEANTTLFAQIQDDKQFLQAGIDARVTSKDFGAYKEANTKVFAQIQDDLSGCVREAYLELYAVSDGKGNVKTFAELVADTVTLRTTSDEMAASLELKAETKTVEALDGRVSDIDVVTADLVARVGDAETSLSLKATKDEVTGVQDSVAKLSAAVDGCVKEAYLELYAVSDGKGNSTTFANLVADTIALKGRVDLTGILAIRGGGGITANGPIYAPNQLIAGGEIACADLRASRNFYYRDALYEPTQITSTTGAVMALGYT